MIVTLTVPETFQIPSFFATATPEETGQVLEVAALLPKWVSKTSGDMDHLMTLFHNKHTDALDKKQQEISTLQKCLNEMQARADASKQNGFDIEQALRTELRNEYQFKMQAYANNFQSSQTFVEQMHREVMEKESRIQELNSQVASLQTPLGRGQAGEWDVASALSSLGFVVEDTSHRGSEGFLDLLVSPDDDSQKNMRLAIEVKNRQEIKVSHLEAFETTIQRGFKDNLYDAALFVSIRTFVRKSKTQSVVLEMFDNDGGRPLVPCLWIGPEKGKHQNPVTQEQLESLVCMQMALLAQCHAIRRDLCQGVKDADMEAVRETVDVFGTEMTEILQDINRQQKLVDDFKGTLTSMRVRCIQMCSSLHRTNRITPWLGRPSVTFPWMDTFLKAYEKKDSLRDAEIWNQLSGNKNVIERSIGKDAMFSYFKSEKKKKREREGGEEQEE